jgi:DNA-directed RNA polymerase subunit RPC12/RpoP
MNRAQSYLLLLIGAVLGYVGSYFGQPISLRLFVSLGVYLGKARCFLISPKSDDELREAVTQSVSLTAWIGIVIGVVLMGCLVLYINSTKKHRLCPACKGRLPDDARKCMHCGEDLAVQPAPAAPAAVIPTPAPQPRAAEKTTADLSIPCPLCGQHLKISTLKQGENYCAHCSGKFIAE